MNVVRIVFALVLLSLPVTSYHQQPPVDASPTVAIDHVALNVADLDASVAFYSGVFGLQGIPSAAKGRRWMSLGKGLQFHL